MLIEVGIFEFLKCLVIYTWQIPLDNKPLKKNFRESLNRISDAHYFNT
jgi:hypothetical protein